MSSKTLRAPNGIVLEFILVTPDMAAKWLERNEANRKISEAAVRSYAEDMRAGNWLTIPHALCFSKDGNLLNGQHTLTALIMSGESIWMLTAQGVGREVAAVMDQGKKRTPNDQLRILGIEDRSGRGLTLARAIEVGSAYFSDSTSRSASFNTRNKQYETHAEAVNFVLGAKLELAVPAITPIGRAFYTKPAAKLVEYMDAVRDGANLPKGHPALVFRNFIGKLTGAGSRNEQIEIYQKSQSALHAFLRGETISKIRPTTGDLFKGVPLTK